MKNRKKLNVNNLVLTLHILITAVVVPLFIHTIEFDTPADLTFGITFMSVICISLIAHIIHFIITKRKD